MRTLYISEQGCSVSLDGETIIIKKKDCILNRAQLPLLEQILVFGNSQITTQTIKACLKRNIPIAYLSQAGYCYGKTYPTSRDLRHLHQLQQQLKPADALIAAQQMVKAKLLNSRTILQRQNRRLDRDELTLAIEKIGNLASKIGEAGSIDKLLGFEGIGAKYYFSGLGKCISNPGFEFSSRSRRPPADPVNAMYLELQHRLKSQLNLAEDNVRFYPLSQHTSSGIQTWGISLGITAPPDSIVV